MTGRTADSDAHIERAEDGLGELTAADGPWSFADAPSGAEFIDFGPLKLPAIAGIKARVEMDTKSGRVGAVSVLVNDCAVQLQVLAARSGKPLWPQVRRTLISRLEKGAGHQNVLEGSFGAELLAIITVRDRNSNLTHDVPMRFVGIDGDKWMVRAVVTGPSVTSDATIARVDALLSRLAVDRGSAAHAEGEVLELAPPPGQIDFDAMPARPAAGEAEAL
jgi:hypothetical protein